MAYPLEGNLPVVPAADLANDTAEVNVRGDARKGGTGGVGKRAGMTVYVDNGGDDYHLAIATGDAPTDKWRVFANGTDVTPA